MGQAYVKALFFIFAAEMGDKTQILAMTLATRFKLRHVITGIFIGSLLNHGLAVSVGTLIGTWVPISVLQLIGGLAFLIFGLWSIRSGEEEEEDLSIKWSPVYTVAFAFFVGELGDKTQLAAISLAMESKFPLITLAGTVSGMMVTSGMGIFLGMKLGNKLSEKYIKIVSFSVFSVFGILKLGASESVELVGRQGIMAILGLWFVAVLYSVQKRRQASARSKAGSFEVVAELLHQKMLLLQGHVEKLCLGESICGRCVGVRCPVGAIKLIMDKNNEITDVDIDTLSRKDIDHQVALESYLELLKIYKDNDDEIKQHLSERRMLERVREILEKIVYNKNFDYQGWLHYIETIRRNDAHISKIIEREI